MSLPELAEGILCPKCNSDNTHVIWKVKKNTHSDRGRECNNCKYKFQTCEKGIDDLPICARHKLQMKVFYVQSRKGFVRRRYKCPKCDNRVWTDEKVIEKRKCPEIDPKPVM